MTPLSSISGQHRGGLFSLTVAAAVAVLVWCGWWLMREEPIPVARQRAFHQIRVRWLCDNGDEFTSFGAYGPRRCIECRADAYVVAGYRCSEHGLFDVRLRHDRGPGERPILSSICFAGGAWQAPGEGLRCPSCDRPIDQVQPNVFATKKDLRKQKDRRP